MMATEFLALAPLLIGAIVRLLKDDTKLSTVPRSLRAPLAWTLGVALAAIDRTLAGGDWREAAWLMCSGPLAQLGHWLFIEKWRGGKEVPLPWLTRGGS